MLPEEDQQENLPEIQIYFAKLKSLNYQKAVEAPKRIQVNISKNISFINFFYFLSQLK
jgi:hypothetical protein